MEKEAFNKIKLINSALNQIRDVLKGSSEVNVSRVDGLLNECSTNWRHYCECVRAMDVARQELFRGMTVKNWNEVEMSVFAWETQFQRVFSALEKSTQSVGPEFDGLSKEQSLDAIRKLVEMLGEKTVERVQCRKNIGFCDAVRICLKKYLYYEGRATRSEYWYFVLFYYLVVILCFFLMVIAGLLVSGFSDSMPLEGLDGVMSVFVFLIGSGLMLPFISVFVRRLHDIGKSGWWYWLSFVPFGGIILLVFCCTPSEERDNEYGPYTP